MNPEHPLRVVLDTKGKTPKTALVVNDDAPTIIFTSQNDIKNFYSKTVETIKVRTQSEHYLNLKQILEILYHRGIKKLLVEGGGTVIWNFIKNGLVDDIYIYVGSYIIGGKETPTLAEGCGVKNEKDLIPLTFINAERLGNGILLHYGKKSVKK
jgi:2,5-diamino-6-(ribosylamino)-4(3H)-pyrimidinone 5'-phosphate reductase